MFRSVTITLFLIMLLCMNTAHAGACKVLDLDSCVTLSNKGDADAQEALGIRYFLGDEVEEDYVRAYIWFEASALKGNEKASRFRDALLGLMTFEQIEDLKKKASRIIKDENLFPEK